MNKALFKALTSFVALAGIVSLTAGCEKFGFSRQIRFNIATAVPGASADTKTAYSGVITEGVERIEWTSGDRIRIYSDKARTAADANYADYAIDASSVENSGATSSVKVGATAGDGHGLEWGSGEHHFWGIYPSHEMGAGTVTGLTISDTQDVIAANMTESAVLTAFAPDMSSAWMLADAAGITEGASSFSLMFYPAFTAFEFTLASQFAKTLKVKSFTLSSADTDIAGTFNASIAADGASTYSDWSSGSHDITVNFGSGVDVTQSKSLTFTVLALPREIPNLSISFGLEIDGNAITRTLALKYSSTHATHPGEYITFPACYKHKISGLALPSGDLKLTQVISDWTVGADYDYISPVTPSLQCWGTETYRRYDTDDDVTDWDGSHIVVSYGYSWGGSVVVTDDPAGYQTENGIPLRPYYSPILELATTSDPVNVLQLQLDNPRFKFIQYGNLGGDPTAGIDQSAIDHTKADHLDIASGAGVKTFFSVVPVEQFTVDETDKACRVSLLSLSPGILHEISFNVVGGSDPAAQSLPGESMNELKFMYFGPAVYGTTGVLKP